MERAPPDGPLNASGALTGEAAAAGGARGFSAAWTAVLAALMALLIVATVLGNALVMLAFVADSSLRTQNNFFLLNLAISDFLVGKAPALAHLWSPRAPTTAGPAGIGAGTWVALADTHPIGGLGLRRGAFCIPLYVPYVLTGRWTFGRGLCKLWLVVDYLLCTSSVFNIVLISYDRFLSVTRAVSYRAQQGDTRRAVQKMLMVWVLAFLLYGPAILSWEYLSGGSSIPEGHCYAEFFYNWYFLITASTLEFFTPFLSVTFFNLSIYLNIQRRTRLRLDGAREATGPEPPPEAQPSPPPPPPGCWGCWQKGHGEAVPLHKCGAGEAGPGAEAGEAAVAGSGGAGAVASPTSSSGSSSRGTERPRSLKRGSKPSASSASLEKRMKMVSQSFTQSFTQRFRLSRDKKVAKSLAVIVGIFGLCWAPYTLLMIIRAACHGHCIPDYWYETSFWLLWANSAVNPVLYPLCHHSFRRAFTKLLCPQKLKLQPHSSLEHWK
ncbi:histamine H3 receptor isoform X2 [Nycticebus coucang]|uniref:histamine H3 receptor isoform X2 n=1 Tax=Nycticebus coucang TaxID=9470 RepID=UPI00234DF1CB|nr:histamine H3 receptor isoform X2 [Nycticebus coucang]